ncbi:MAG: hypothetical protein JNK04_14930 [Myxococcales bacterium]|nr:hypothetical protein [Myxococcales bacterium]
MRFMVLVKGNADSEAGKLPSEAELSAMGDFNQGLIDAGMMLGGEGLKQSSSGVRVRYRDGKTTVVDGPFAEAKELVAGYWLLRAGSKDELVERLKGAPCFDQGGELEVRELYEAEDFGGDSNAPAPPQPPAKPNTRRYLTMLFADRFTEAGGAPSPELVEKMGGLMGEIASQGALLSGDGLKPSSKGAKIVFNGKDRRVVDGPFTETKEIIAGISVVRATSKEEAVEWARRMLVIHCEGVGVKEGQVEVRQIMETSDFPVDPNEKAGGWRDQENAFRERTGQG